MKNYKIAVAGTGYVGLSIATLLSQHNNRKSPILDDYIEKIQVRLKPWMYAKAAYSDADFVVIAAPTNVYSTNHIDVETSKRTCFAHYIGC